MHEYLPFWAVAMLLAGGLFAGGAFAVAWGLIPMWQKLPAKEFKASLSGFAEKASVVQPIMGIAAIISSIGYAVSCHGTGVTLSTLAATGYILALLFTAVYMMPLQRKIRAAKAAGSDLPILRNSWVNGHYLRTALAILSFALACGAVAVHL